MKKIYHIVIEGSVKKEMQDMFEIIQNRYKLFDNCVLEEAQPQDSIIDYEDNRYKETGNLEVLGKSVVLKAQKEAEAKGVRFTTNLKGLNLLEIGSFSRYISDKEAEDLCLQLHEGGFCNREYVNTKDL